MTSLKRRLRSLLIAFAVLALSAGVAMAGRGAHLAATDATGPTAHSDQAEPDEQAAQAADEDAEAPETEAPETEAPETEAPDTETTDEGQTTAPQDAPTGTHPDNHGLLVSEAAQVPPVTGQNHGAAVRVVAMDNHGHSLAAASKTKHAPKAPH